MALNIGVENRGAEFYIVCLDGRLDTATASAFEEKINPLLVPATKTMVLNLEKLIYISSAGLRVIFKIQKALSAHQASFVMTNLQPQIQRVFEIVKALPDTPIFESIEEADRYLDAMQKEELDKQKRSPNA
ncbi:MAG: STAS domain-containing protein [Candidatus Omnitrophica bacterium]|nr:STAS domain-containing protein [Candidatus Omnitrophota bacterium]MDD5671963.1 STAS domain-containing protein [Candidatus Omnitrophota bacterium]